MEYSAAPVECLQYLLWLTILPVLTDKVNGSIFMIRSSLATATRIIAFTLALHLFASTGFTGTVPARLRHRRVVTAHQTHQTAAAKRRMQAPPVKRAISVATRIPV